MLKLCSIMNGKVKYIEIIMAASFLVGPSAAQTPARPITQKPRLNIPVVVIYLKPYGLEPKTVSIPKGDVYLVLDNKSGARNVSMQINRVLPNVAASSKVQDLPTKQSNLTTGQVVTMQPGNYIITEANHPEWQTKLTVTGN